jgi:hypothetical protein
MMSAEANADNDDSDKIPESSKITMVSLANASSKSSEDDDDDDDDEKIGSTVMVSLVSGDGQKFELPQLAAKDSGMVREALNLKRRWRVGGGGRRSPK